MYLFGFRFLIIEYRKKKLIMNASQFLFARFRWKIKFLPKSVRIKSKFYNLIIASSSS